ncbi:MAG TPA: OFA family MFS transporter [Pirellulales bacterium]|jgi:MFS family permease|nr:OFA family MFS transporter [Pirellulales bacterium]
MSSTGFFSKQAIVAPPGYNRWRVPPASMAIHLCIGSVYAWSVFNPALVKVHGVVASAADDWTLSQVVWVFTVAIVFLGLAAAVGGKWLEQVGPRTVGMLAAVCWGGGLIIGGVGVALHRLELLYLGYGAIGGCGLGLGYVSPVSTLIRWFPDRRGMATGLAIMGFGGGAIIAAPLNEALMRTFYRAPQFLGHHSAVQLTTIEGKRFAQVDGRQREVVLLGSNEVSQLLVPTAEGVYVVGTGHNGAAQTFWVLGSVYLVVMLAAALSYRIPATDWHPAGWSPPAAAEGARRMISSGNVDVDQALHTPQFYLLWLMLCFNVTAGIAVLGVAKTMLSEIFGSSLPSVVDSGFAVTYVLMASVFNMIGRFFWASASDYLGRKQTYAIFFGAGALLYLAIPWIAQRMSVSPSVAWLAAFYAVTMTIFTMYGGGFATIPAYLADLFGTRYVGAIHGRLLTAWSTAGVLGPLAITSLRDHAVGRAIHGLSATIPPDKFTAEFGASPSQLPQLIAAKSVTIAKLLALSPPETPDPYCTLYNTTMYLMAGLLAVALVANALVRPVAARHHLAD